MSPRHLIALTLATAAAVGSWMLLGPRPGDVEDDGDSTLTGGYYLKGATITTSDADGNYLYTLRAERIDQHPADGSVELTNLRLDYAQTRDVPWVITASTGSMPSDGSRLELAGDIEISGAPTASTGALAVTTETLTVLPIERTASTTAEVQVVQDSGILKATGLDADLRAERLVLKTDIRGVFGAESQP